MTDVTMVNGYESEVVEAHRLRSEYQSVCDRFNKLPWVLALFAQRDYDHRNKVPMYGRTYEITDDHEEQLYFFGRNRERLYGFELVVVSYGQYAANHFRDGVRINFVDDRNFHLIQQG